MGIIHLLENSQTHKIAAGQVIERPACIVKELIENALDAHATAITIYIKQAGTMLIKVIDNGKGMDKEDVHKCFERHATSKITTFDDITRTTTFGFRGEALAALASVSHVELQSRQAEQLYGNKVIMHYGNLVHSELCDMAYGTSVSVHELFSNIPVRRKFLKSEETERKNITYIIEGFCLAYPAVHFKYFSNDILVLAAPATTNLKNRLTQVLDSSKISSLLSLEHTAYSHESIQGVISNQHTGYYNKNYMFFLVNNRLVKNHALSAAVIRGYDKVLPANKYPLCVIKIEIDPYLVDINIDPAKRQVRFVHPHRLETLISRAVTTALAQKEIPLAQGTPVITNNYIAYKPVAPADKPSLQQPLFSNAYSAPVELNNMHKNNAFPQELFRQIPSAIQHQETDTQHSTMTPTNDLPLQHSSSVEAITTSLSIFLGQIHATYLLYSTAQGLIIVDQHAAHECILFAAFENTLLQAATTMLAFPIFITLASNPATAVVVELLARYAIGLEIISSNQAVIRQVPTHLKNSDMQDIVDYTCAVVEKYDTSALEDSAVKIKINKVVQAQMACKAAIKASQTVTQEQAQKLYQDLMLTPQNVSCPHGRPTRWLVDKAHLEKMFKRRK